MSEDSARFILKKRVGPESIDGLGHVSNLVYVEWVLEAATAHSEAVGYDEARYAAEGFAFVVRRQEIDYLRPTFEGDELEIETWVESWSRTTSRRRTIIRKAEVELALGLTTWVLVDRARGRPLRISEALAEAFSAPPMGHPPSSPCHNPKPVP